MTAAVTASAATKGSANSLAKMKPARLVQLDDIISNQIIGDDPEIIALVMRIHLALEALIIETIRTFDVRESVYDLSFPGKTTLLANKGLISTGAKAAFDAFNKFRNSFAHIFGHKVTIQELLALARDLERQGIDFSDSIGHYPPETASVYYDGLEGILAEIGWCLLSDAAEYLRSAGGREITAI